ncbi:MAG: CPBP family intramembrane glutamic endopeptidase [Myxococcota bacterium]
MSRIRVIAFYGFMLMLALAVGGYQGALGDWLPGVESLPGDLACGLLAGLAVVALSRLAHHRFSWARRLSAEFQAILSRFRRRDALVIAAMSALGEELWFRGVLQGSFPDPLIGVILTAAVFAALHVGPSRVFVPWTVMAFVVGLMFGVLTWITGNLLAAVIAHGIINYLNLREILSEDDADLYLGPLGHDRVIDEAL